MNECNDRNSPGNRFGDSPAFIDKASTDGYVKFTVVKQASSNRTRYFFSSFEIELRISIKKSYGAK